MTISAGIIDIAFGLFHFAFWRLFHWPQTLVGSGKLNTSVTQLLNAVLTYVFFAYGGAIIFFTLKGMTIHPAVLWLGAGFWALRFALDFAGSNRADPVEKAFSAAFILSALAHAVAALGWVP